LILLVKQDGIYTYYKNYFYEININRFGSDFMPKIILYKQNGQRICINCTKVPPAGGAPGTLEIPGVEIRTHTNDQGDRLYDYLWFPPAADSNPAPGDLVISLTGPLHEDNMILPFNGGHIPAEPPDQPREVTVKLGH
jgi:hypothetical protein